MRSTRDGGLILIIDYDFQARYFYKMQLSYLNMNFDVALTAREGLRKLSSRHSAVVIEMVLPDVDGLTVATTIRERFDYLANIPIVAVSKIPIKGISKQCKQARINALLKKPLDSLEFAEAMRRYVQGELLT